MRCGAYGAGYAETVIFFGGGTKVGALIMEMAFCVGFSVGGYLRN